MASPTYRASSTAGAATAANLTINKPTGTADGDILVAFISKDNTAAVTAPAGWNLIGEATANAYYSGAWWKRAASEGASWQWTFTSIWRTGCVAAYQGAIGTGTALDPDPPAAFTETQNNTLATNSNTTASTDTVVVAMHSAVGFVAPWTAGSSMTERVAFDEVHLQDIAQAAAGATGTKTASQAGATNQFMKAVLIEIASTTGGAAQDTPELYGRPFGLDGYRQMHQLLAQ